MHQIVWLKRDIRLQDHAPIYHASKAGPTLLLYIVEPSIWEQPDLSLRHFHFVLESVFTTADQAIRRRTIAFRIR